jgi:multicomponent K+:H+ antiporter subunit A
MTTLLAILLPFLAIIPAWIAQRYSRTASTLVATTAAAASLGLLFSRGADVLAGRVFVDSWPWVAALNLNFSLRLDGLGLLFSILILGIGLLVLLYARFYLSEDDPIGPFHAMLLTFMGAMLGVVLSENLLLMVMFWELTSISSFFLIAYWSHLPEARKGARLALTITGGGGLALLAGVLMLGHVVGSYELSDVLASNDVILSHATYPALLILVLLGAFTKSAQFPFHFWLPNAMTAPTPVSAYLHSATMVKAGVFLLARMHPALSGSDMWFYLVTGAGLTTLLFGAYVALFKDDLKGLLAYSTISHLGLITALLGFSTKLATIAALFHIMNHAAFKAALFMTAGIVDHEAGTRDARLLGGLRHLMPITFTLGTLAAASMAGLPPFNGFLSKELFFEEGYRLMSDGRLAGTPGWIVPVLATVGGLVSIAYSIRFVSAVFLGEKRDDYPHQPHDPPIGMWLPVAILASICVLVGLAPEFFAAPLLAAASQAATSGALPEYQLSLWHGFTPALGMTGVALALGFALYANRERLLQVNAMAPAVSGMELTESFFDRVMAAAGWFTERVDGGSLQKYLSYIIGVSIITGFWAFLELGWQDGRLAPTEAPPLVLLPWGLLIAACVFTVYYQRKRLAAVVFMSVIGLLVSLIFVYFSAPDLGLTQLAVEVVTILLILLAMHVLPERCPPDSTGSRRLRDATLSILAGFGTAALAWGAMTRPLDSISSFYIDKALSEGGGTNIVNVILVDFRGFDTMGEISVLVIAAVGIVVMLRGNKPPRPIQVPVMDEERFPVMLTSVTRPLMPLVMLIAVYIFFRGHNLPGGGFIAGLVAAVTLLMQYLASGLSWSNARVRINYLKLGGFGVLIAIGTGASAVAMGKPFLTHVMGHPKIPLLGEFHIGTPALFDLGVFLAVVGALMVILGRLSEYQRSSYDDAETKGDA